MQKKTGRFKKAGWFYISIFFIFAAAVILIVCAREMKKTSEQTEQTLSDNIAYASVACENLLTDAVNVLNVNYFTAQYMYDHEQTTENLRNYFTDQTDYLRDQLGMAYLGVYGYIDGELLFSEPWTPPADYRVEDRPWYREMKANGTKLTLSTPYVDAKSGKMIVTIGRMFEDGKNMIAVDLSLESLSDMIMAMNYAAGVLYIVDAQGVTCACKDRTLVGQKLKDIYADSSDLQQAVSEIDASLLSEEDDVAVYKSDVSWISVKRIMENWYVVVLIDRGNVNLLAAKNAIPSAAMAAVALFVFFMLYINLFLKMYSMKRENDRLSEDMETLASGTVLADADQIKRIVFYIYLLFSFYFLMAFHDYAAGNRFVVVTVLMIPVAVYLTFAKKVNVRMHGFYMTGVLFIAATMYGLVPEGQNRLTDIFLAIAVVISLYQKLELNVFLLAGTMVYDLYVLVAGGRARADGVYEVSDGVTDMILLLIGHVMLLIVIAWNRQLQIRLQQKATEAADAANSKAAFLANISHEIRTPLNAILGMNELVLRESRQPHIKEYAMYIKNSGKTLQTIIGDVLDLSKLESGKVYIASEPYTLSGLVEDVERTIQKRVMEKGLMLKIYVDPELHEHLRGDEVRMKQILMNLLTNAVKYTEKGEVRLYITGTAAENREHLAIEVSDTGIGMRHEDMDKLFMDFERLDLKRNRSIEGTGLGLPITKRLLIAMGGDISVSSVYGRGSTFTASVEQEITGEERIGEYRERYKNRMRQETIHQPAFSADGARILIVDDNEVNRRIVSGLVKGTGLTVDGAGSAAEGLTMIRKHVYHLLLIDHMMPEMDGVEMLARVREMDGGIYSRIPAIAITANVYAGAREKYQALGFDDYLGKPIDTDKFDRILKAYLPDMFVKAWNGRPCDAAEEQIRLPEIPGVDTEKGLSYISGSVDLYIHILESYLDGSEERIRKLSEAKKNRDLSAYDIVIHGIKGVSASIGADEMAQTAGKLEEACRNPETGWSYIEQHHSHAVQEYRNLLEEIKKWLANIETNGKIENGKIVDEAEILEVVNDMKTAVYEYREKDARDCLDRLYDAEIPRVAEAFGAAYRGTLDKLYAYLSDYEMDQAYELTEKLEKELGGLFS